MENFNLLNTRGLHLERAMATALQAEESRNFNTPLQQDLAVGLSSGTSGNRGIFVVSQRERAIWVAAVLHRVIGFSWRRRRVAFFLRADNKLYQSVKSRLLQFQFFDTLKPFASLQQQVQQLQPQVLVAQPSILHQLAQAQQAGNLSIHPRQIIAVAEVLEPQVQQWVAAVFNTPVKQVYQCTEGFLAATCSQGHLHFNEDLLMIEPPWLNEDKTICHPVITDFTRRLQPIVNYLLNDVVQVDNVPCPCGSPFMRINRIEGRADDLLVFTKTNQQQVWVLPDTLRRLALLNLPVNVQYQIEQVAPHQLIIRLQGQQPLQTKHQLLQALAAWCQSHQLLIPQCTFTDNWEPVPGQKLRRIIGPGINADGPLTLL